MILYKCSRIRMGFQFNQFSSNKWQGNFKTEKLPPTAYFLAAQFWLSHQTAKDKNLRPRLHDI